MGALSLAGRPLQVLKRMTPGKFCAAAFAIAASMTAYAEHYKVIVPLNEDANGAQAILLNYDNGNAIDTVTVADQVAVFEGEIDEPLIARVNIDGGRGPVFILESGTISFNKNNDAFGTMYNDQIRAISEQLTQIANEFRAATTEEAQNAAYQKYNETIEKSMAENGDNIVGYFCFLNGDSSQMDAGELREVFGKYPAFARYARSQKLLANAEKREATQPGKKFVDFEVKYNGETKRLSDYVGKGKYVLVDFWASWCGPCIRQTEVLKQIYKKYGREILDVLGVAVWDEPDATLKAIKDHQLPWESILNAQTIPTDLYGITGIPCIILFGPDGTILSRDKQSEELIADVDRELAKTRIVPRTTNETEGAPFSR